MTTVHEINAANQSLGRVASRIAILLRGKDQPSFTPNIMPDVSVVVHNLKDVTFKGTKTTSTLYWRHSGFPGGIRSKTLEEMWAANPEKVLRLAVRGMLPPNRSRDRLLKKVTVK